MASRKDRPHDLPHDPSESQLHASVAQFLDWALLPPTIWTTFPAGWGKLTKGTAGRLYACGLKKGMPDILVFCRRDHNSSYVVGIELKAGRNGLSSAQRTMFAALQGVGIPVYVCRSIEDVAEMLTQEGISCRQLEINANGPGSTQRTERVETVRPDFFRPPT